MLQRVDVNFLLCSLPGGKICTIFYCYIYGEYLTNEALEGFGDLKIRKVICAVKYTDGLMILAKEYACTRT
jgi:hypothetical protein